MRSGSRGAPFARPLVEQSVKIRCALGEQALDWRVEDVGEQERVVERRGLLSCLGLLRWMLAGSRHPDPDR